jgi:PAS domain S-box-containing protein
MDQALGSVCLDYARPEHRGLLKEKIQHAFRTGCPDAFEVQGQGTMNTTAWYSIRLAPIKTDNAVNQVLMITTNITERKQAEERLRESEERYRLISENTADVIWVLDPLAGRFKYVSPSVEKLSGYTPAEVMEQPVSAALTPDSFQRVANLLAEHLPAFIAKGSGSESFVTEVDQPRRDGSIVNTEVTTTVMFNQQGEVEVIGVSRDITERKQTEQAVRENEERLRLSLQAASQGLYDLNVQTGNAIVNREYAEMLGYEYETFVETNTSWIGRLHPDDREITAKAYADYIDGLRPDYRVEFRQRTRDDGWKWILSLGKVIAYDEEGKPLRMLGTHTDITERKQAEEALKQNEHVLRLFVEHSPASIAMFDRDMRYIVASRRYITDYRLPHQDLTGRSHYEVFPEIPEHWKENHRRCLAGAVEKMEEDPFPREDGSLDWVRWEIRPWYEETDRIGGIILFSEVITDRKQIQDDLRLLNVSLEQRVTERTMELSYANRAKDEFLANMSHELRTPLNAILGLSESLLEQRRGPLNERQVQSIELVASSGKHLLSLINDILEVSKIEAGRLDLHTDSVSVKELCASSLNFIRELALKKLITVDFACDDSISIIEADPQRLKQILINLLTNAVKFTPERGRVGLQVSTNAARDQVLFSITDTGIGIAQEDLKKLFTPFTQLDSSLARQYAGTGLGLSLVQKLTEAHGGRIQVESEAGRGSRFTVVLPLTRKPGKQAFEEGNAHYAVSGQEPASPRDLSTKHITVLLVEDNHVNSDMMRTYVESYGYTVLIAQNGEEVLQKVEEITPHIIVMDIQMPKLDGLETTRRLRQDTRFTTTPIIALTALVMPGDRERCLEAGANEYLSKPVSLKTLISLIEKLT